MIKPKPFTLEDMDGDAINIIMSRFPATVGREILAKYPTANMPKIGDYVVSEETMLKLMSYVSIPVEDGDPIVLKTKALVDNHTHDAETLMKIEMAMLEYNCSFFRKGRISDFLGEFVQMIVAKIIATSTLSSEQSSPPAPPLSTSSEQSTI